jgi:hypothetical protein
MDSDIWDRILSGYYYVRAVVFETEEVRNIVEKRDRKALAREPGWNFNNLVRCQIAA